MLKDTSHVGDTFFNDTNEDDTRSVEDVDQCVPGMISAEDSVARAMSPEVTTQQVSPAVVGGGGSPSAV